MNSTIENDILFDDITLLEAILGNGSVTATAKDLSPDCNCSSYTSIDDDEAINTTESTRIAF